MTNLKTDFTNKKVLITGGLGFIGSNLAIRLVKLGADVTLVDSLIPEYGGNLFNINPVKAAQIESLLVTFNSEQASPLYPSSTELPVLIDKYDGQVIDDADEYIYWSN